MSTLVVRAYRRGEAVWVGHFARNLPHACLPGGGRHHGAVGDSGQVQGTLFSLQDQVRARATAVAAEPEAVGLESELRAFDAFGTVSLESTTTPTGSPDCSVPTWTNEFWTSRQRAAHSLHEVSYRACFKPQLPRFFIERLTEPGDVVHDPFLGRGTTAVEAALAGRVPTGTDVNPLSRVLVASRLHPPRLSEIEERLDVLDLRNADVAQAELDAAEDLHVFYHPETLRELLALRGWLARRVAGDTPDGTEDHVDRWIRMVAVNRLTGHSTGFFSVYTLPPNQAVSVEAQRRINEKRDQSPPRRSVPDLILRKSASLLKGCTEEDRAVLAGVADRARILTGPGAASPDLADASVALVVTSPPFLDVVRYQDDNWLRCWFCGIDAAAVPVTHLKKVEAWQAAMTDVFVELRRLLRPGGHVAFEVGEVRGGKIPLEEVALAAGLDAGLDARLVLINAQEFTKTANCWGVENNQKGTNTNRIALFKKP